MRRLLLVSAAVLVSGSAFARPFTARDLAGLDRVSDAHVSPDGRQVLFDVRSTDYDANKGKHAIWMR